MIQRVGLALASLGLLLLSCSSPADVSTVERVFLPRAAEETFSAPLTVVRWSELGLLEGGIQFSRTRVFLPPNRYAELVAYADAGVSSVRLWDGTQFLEQTPDGFRKLDATTARALFDRALEAAVLFRETDVEPSLAVECAARDRARATEAGVEVRVDVYRVSHGRAGFERALEFDTNTHYCLGWLGSRHLDGRALPADCQAAYTEMRLVEGRLLPFSYVITSEGREIESVNVTEYRIDATEERDLEKLLRAP